MPIIIIIIIIIVRLAPIQCIAPLAANNLQSGLFSASSAASSTLKLWYDRSFFTAASQEVLAFSNQSDHLELNVTGKVKDFSDASSVGELGQFDPPRTDHCRPEMTSWGRHEAHIQAQCLRAEHYYSDIHCQLTLLQLLHSLKQTEIITRKLSKETARYALYMVLWKFLRVPEYAHGCFSRNF